VDVTAPQSDVTFHFYNGTRGTFRHPDPIEPTDVVVRWVGAAGDVTAGHLRVLLPIALGPGGNLERVVTLPVSVAPGDYSVTLSPASRPELIVARRVVDHAQDPR
jgi:hypothetical protein